jgi:hypothetical protein
MLGLKHFFLFTIKKGSLGSEEDFMKLKKKELYHLWYVEEYFDAGLARGYNITKKQVKEQREKLGVSWIGSGLSFIGGHR